MDNTKSRIVEAALQTLKQRGFAGCSAREIAKQGGFNQALVFYHFGSVHNLLLAALDLVSNRRMQAYQPPFEQAQTVAELAALARTIYAEDLENGYVTVLAEMVAGGMSDPDPAIRSAFVTALGAVGPASAKALPGIMQALDDPEASVRHAAAFAIGRIGGEAKAAIPLLEKKLLEKDLIEQIACAWALVKIDPQREGLAGECVEPLLRALRLPDPQARAEAAAALGEIGPAAAAAKPALDELAKDPDETVQKAAAAALKKIAR